MKQPPLDETRGFAEAQRTTLHRSLSNLERRPAAIEAYWDGDTQGWFVVLAAIIGGPLAFITRKYQLVDLAAISEPGGDMRLFNGHAPPWPEARRATQLGLELADQLGVPFFFASPEHPQDDCPHWWQRRRAKGCSSRGILLLQPKNRDWHGTCHICQLHAKRDTPAPDRDQPTPWPNQFTRS